MHKNKLINFSVILTLLLVFFVAPNCLALIENQPQDQNINTTHNPYELTTTDNDNETYGQDEKILQYLDGKSILLSDIIESYFTNTSLVDLALEEFKPQEQNQVRSDLATKWVKNASTRIFCDKMRSFLEAVVNSCDTYRQERTIGKFGMGFFSMLSLLGHEETGGTLITVKTCYNASPNQDKYAYQITIELREEQIFVRFDLLPPNIFAGKTGTIVSITPKNNRAVFSEKNLRLILQYIHLLDFYSEAHIELNFQPYPRGKLLSEEIGTSSSQNPNRVICDLLPKKISSQDFGSGIPVSVALTKLLIPTASTKPYSSAEIIKLQEDTLNHAPIARFVTPREKHNKTPQLVIGVNDVVVVMVTTEDGDKDVYMSMPQLTKLTLARNEIVFAGKDSFEERYIKKVISKTINHVLLEEQEDQDNLLMIFYRGLKKWEEQSFADIRGKFTSYFKEELKRLFDENSNIIPIPSKYYENFLCILNQDDENTENKVLIAVDGDILGYNYKRLEKFLQYHYPNSLSSPYLQSPYINITRDASAGKLLHGFNTFFINDNCFAPSLMAQVPFVHPLGLTMNLFVPEKVLGIPGDGHDRNLVERNTINNILALATEYDTLQNYETLSSKPYFLLSNYSPHGFISDTYYNHNWVSEPLNHGFFAMKKLAIFGPKDRKLLEEFFTKHQNLLLDKHLLTTIYPKRLSVFSGEDYVQFSASKTFKEYITRGLLLSDHDAIKSQGQSRKDIYYFFYDTKEKHFFASSLLLDSLESLGAPTDYLYWDKPIAHNTERSEPLWDCITKKCPTDMRVFLRWAKQHQAYDKYYDDRCTLPHGENNDIKVSDFIDLALQNLDTPNKIEAYENVIKGIKSYLISSGKTLSMEDFMNNLFGSLLLPFGEENVLNNNKTIFAMGQQVWPIQGELSLNKIEKLFFALLAHFLDKSDSSYHKNTLSNQDLHHLYTSWFEPQLDTKVLAELYRKIYNFAGWYVSRRNALEQVMPNLNILGSIIDQFQWSIDDQKHGLSATTRALIDELQNTIFALYNNYINIPDSRLHRDYGFKNAISVINPQRDVTNVDVVYDLIATLQSTPTLLKKLIKFQIEDFSFQTNIVTRDHDLQKLTFYNPTMLSNTPISVLALLRERGIHHNIITTIIDEAATPGELMLSSYLVLTKNICNYFNPNHTKLEKIEELSSALRLIIKRFFRERMGTNKILEICGRNRIEILAAHRITNIANEPSIIASIDFLQSTYEQNIFIPERKKFHPDNVDDSYETTFKLSQLLKAHMSDKGLESDLKIYDLNTAINKINSQQENINLGKITQSIEANDEKNSLFSSVTETMQNSSDAIVDFITKQTAFSPRKAKNDLSQIKYTLEWMNDVNHKTNLTHICLTARDFIGFPNLKALLTDFALPDYSNKKSTAIGEMGNGLFKMYRDANKILVMTRLLEDPSKAYMLIITPVVDNLTKSIKDLEITCRDISTTIPADFFGTSIRILFNSKPSLETNADLLMLVNFFKTNVSVSKVDLPNSEPNYISIYLNDILLNNSSEFFMETINKENTETYKFRLRRLKATFMPSQVTAGGIHFASMSNFVKEYSLLPPNLSRLLASGFVLDLNKGTYAPVVSRNHLQITPENIKILRQLLLDACYQHGLNIGRENVTFLERNFLHFGSPVELFDQLSLNTNDNRDARKAIGRFLNDVNEKELPLSELDFFTNYQPTLGISFFDAIANGYLNLLSQIKIIEWKLRLEANIKLKLIEYYLKLQASVAPNDQEYDKIIEKGKKEYENLVKQYKEQFIQGAISATNNWASSIPDNRYNLTQLVVVPWFTKKFNLPLTKEFGLKTKRQQKKETEVKHFVLSSTQPSVKDHPYSYNNKLVINTLEKMFYLYGKILLTKVGAENNLKGVKFFYSSTICAAGYYQPITKKIAINLMHADITGMLEVLSYFLELEENGNTITPLSNLASFRKIFIPEIYNTPVFIHELEHARRWDYFAYFVQSFHNKCTLKNGETVAFDICANEYARDAKNSGLIIDWQKQFSDFLKKMDKKQIKTLKESIDTLARLIETTPIQNRKIILKQIFS